MTIDRTIRKPFSKMTRADFSSYPVWEWAVDEEGIGGHDETTLRSTAHIKVPQADFSQYIVKADARLRDGTILPACVEVTVKGKRWHFAPRYVFMLDRKLDFVGMESTSLLSRYTKALNNYPAKWALTVPLEGETRLRTGRVRRGLFMQLVQLWMLWRTAKGKP